MGRKPARDSQGMRGRAPRGTVKCAKCREIIGEGVPRVARKGERGGRVVCLQCVEEHRGTRGYAIEMMRRELAGEPLQQAGDGAMAAIEAAPCTSSRGRPRTLSAKVKSNLAR